MQTSGIGERAKKGRSAPALALLVSFGALGACGDDDSLAMPSSSGGGMQIAGASDDAEGSARGGSTGEAGSGGAASLNTAGTQTEDGAGAHTGGATGGADSENTAGAQMEGGAAATGEEAGGEGGAQGEPPRWLAYVVQGGTEVPLYAVSTLDAEPVEIAPNVSSFSVPEWRPDGAQLLYVEYFCCGLSNGGYTVDVSNDGLGEPVPIHEPLSGGETIRNALYAAGGEALVAEFVDASNSSRWAFRWANAGPGDWQTVTPGETLQGPAGFASKAPDGSAVVLIEMDVSDQGQRVYLVDFETGESPMGVLVHETHSPAASIFEVIWSPDSDSFVLSGYGAPLWVSRDTPTQARPLSASEHFFPYASTVFSSNATAVLFSAANTADEASASQGVFVRSIAEAGPSALTTVLPPPSEHLGFVHLARWLDGERVVFLSDARTDEVNELFLGDRAGSSPTPILDTLPPGEFVNWFEVAGSELVFTTSDPEGSFQNMYLIDPRAGASVEPVAVTSFSGGADAFAVPLGVRPNGLAFTTFEVNPESGAFGGARVSYLALGDARTERADVTDELPVGAAVAFISAWSDDGKFFAYSGDFDADGFTDVSWFELVDGMPEGPMSPVSILEGTGSAVGLFAWQPRRGGCVPHAVTQNTRLPRR